MPYFPANKPIFWTYFCNLIFWGRLIGRIWEPRSSRTPSALASRAPSALTGEASRAPSALTGEASYEDRKLS